MENEPQGPYRIERIDKHADLNSAYWRISGPGGYLKLGNNTLVMYSVFATLTVAHTEGVKAGRASRDGLVKAMRYAIAQHFRPDDFNPAHNHWSAVLSNALAEDEKGGKHE